MDETNVNVHPEDISVLAHLSSLINEMDKRYAERDRRYQERFEAQTKALDAAFLSQQAAVQAALVAQEKAVQTAMTASEKAVAKAEVAAEKRFDNVNEFRQSLNDIISKQMPRTEAEQRISAMSEKLSAATAENQNTRAGLLTAVTQRLDDIKEDVSGLKIVAAQSIGRSTGMSDTAKLITGGIGLVATILTIVVIMIALL